MKFLFVIMIALATAPIQQARVGVVAGTILTKNRTPAAGVRVSAVMAPDSVVTFPSGTIVTSVLTDDSGRYRLEEIPPGRYYITAGLVELPSYYPGVASAEKAMVIAVTAGTQMTGVDFAMSIPSVTVSGRVVFQPNHRLAGTQSVTLLSENLYGVKTQDLKPDGSFEFSGVSPGSYMLIAQIPSSSQPQASNPATSAAANPTVQATGFVSNPSAITRTVFVSQVVNFGVPLTDPDRAAMAITVTDQDITGLALTPPLTVPVTGGVIVEGSLVVPDLSISFVSASRTTSAVQRDGTFWARLIEGEYRVVASLLPSGYYLKSIVAGKTDLTRSLLRLSGSDPAEIIVTLGTLPETGGRN